MEEDGRAVLCAPVRALAVEGGGVVESEEGVQKLLEADLRGVEVHLDHLGVAGLVGADILVAGPLQRTALIADGRRRHAGDGRKGRLDSPKTSRSEGCFFEPMLIEMSGSSTKKQIFTPGHDNPQLK